MANLYRHGWCYKSDLEHPEYPHAHHHYGPALPAYLVFDRVKEARKREPYAYHWIIVARSEHEDLALFRGGATGNMLQSAYAMAQNEIYNASIEGMKAP